MGDNGSRRYDWETKVAAARDHVENGMTKTEVMARYGIVSIAPLERWCREYRAGGPEALRPKPKGRPKGARSRPKPKPFCKVKRPGEVRKLMGVWVEEIDALAPDETIEVHGDAVDAKGQIVASIIHREGAERLATYGGDEFYAGHSALTVNAYGKGKAYFVGTPLDETGMSAFMAPIIKELDLKSLDTPGGCQPVRALWRHPLRVPHQQQRRRQASVPQRTQRWHGAADRHRHQRSDRA